MPPPVVTLSNGQRTDQSRTSQADVPKATCVHRTGWPGLSALLLAAGIAVELLILRRYFFLQPVIAGIGAAEILLAWRWQRSGRIVTRSRDQGP
jgi:hypothetical protein